MTTRSIRLAALCVAATLIGTAAVAETPSAADAASPRSPAHTWAGQRVHAIGAFHHVLRQLNLTPEQQTQIKSIFAQARSDLKTRWADARANHEALTATAPTEPGYPALLAAEKSNAAARVQAISDLKAQVYAVLTPEQQSKIPQILAADKAARAARFAARHANSPTT